MSSAIRKIQIKIMQRKGIKRVPVHDPVTGRAVAFLYPLYKGQTERPNNWELS